TQTWREGSWRSSGSGWKQDCFKKPNENKKARITMKGDFTRDTFDPTNHYQQVLMQQGRAQLDADWNEQAALGEHRDETTTADIVGDCGGPAEGAAFNVFTDVAELSEAEKTHLT